MNVIRASDGAWEECSVGPRDFESIQQLNLAISKLLSLPLEALILFLSDGRELNSSVFQELWETSGEGGDGEGLVDIYVFDRESFVAVPEEWVKGLEEEVVLANPLPARPPMLKSSTSPLEVIAQNHSHLLHLLLPKLLYQLKGLRIAGDNLFEHLEGLSRGVYGEGEGEGGEEVDKSLHASEDGSDASSLHSGDGELDDPSSSRVHKLPSWHTQILTHLAREEALIVQAPGRGIEEDLRVIQAVPVLECFLSERDREKLRKSEEGGARKRKRLGDFVNEGKMRQVRDSCLKIYEDHQTRHSSLLTSLSDLQSKTQDLMVASDSLIIEVEGEIEGIVGAAERDWEEVGRLSREESGLRLLDDNIREQVLSMTRLKTEFTLQLHIHLHQISIYQSTIASLPSLLASLEESLQQSATLPKTGFPHLHRLNQMLFAYGSTCIEVLWRKETNEMILASSSQLAENVAKLLVREKKRRKVFQEDVVGLLPWPVEGLSPAGGEGVTLGPSVDISARGGGEALGDWKIGREDVLELFEVIGGLVGTEMQSGVDQEEPQLLRTKARLEELLAKMDASIDDLRKVMLAGEAKIEAALPHSVNGTIPANASTSTEKAVTTSTNDHSVNPELIAKIEQLESVNAGLRNDIQGICSDKDDALNQITKLRGTLESERADRAQALTEGDGETEKLRAQLREAEIEISEIKRQLRVEQSAHQADLAQIQQLEDERSQILNGLGDARTAEDHLAAQLEGVQAELAATMLALDEARADREQTLRNQSAEAERMLRDRLTEADGDRAVLEHQSVTLAKDLENLKMQSDADLAAAKSAGKREAQGLKAELNMAHAQLRDAQTQRVKLLDELSQEKESVILARKEEEKQAVLGRDAIRVASSYHDCISRLHSAIQSSATISGSSLLVGKSMMKPGLATPPPGASDEEKAQPPKVESTGDEGEDALLHELASLKTYDLNSFSEAVTRTMSLVKKWQKSCKQYRDKAKDKLAFANFAKGDLALFLPTRNSAIRPWAAFNMSSPHNFLKPTEAMEEQIKVREWIVARITKIEEDVVDSKRPDSNPYGLAEGIRFFILHVEQYIPTPARARRSSSTGMLDTPAILPLESANTITTEQTPLAGERARTDYFSTVPRPSPATGDELTSHMPSISPPDVAADRNSLAAQRNGSSEGMAFHRVEPERRRPSSVASSSGSFRGGIHLGGSVKAVSTSAITRNTPATATAIAAHGAPDLQSLGSPPFAGLSTSPSAGLLAGLRPRVSSHTPSMGGMFVRKDPGKASATGPVGMGEGALDILKRLEGGGTT